MNQEVDHVKNDHPIGIHHVIRMDVFTNVVKQLFPQHVYPSQSTLKEILKSYLEEAYPEFMSDMSPNEFTNHFHSEWCSSLLSKMKNYHEAASQNVRHAIWQTFGSEKLPFLNSNASVPEIVNWKKSSQVAACFRSLFEQTESGVYWIDMIARSAFSTAACTEKLMKRRLKQYLDDLNGEGPSYESAQAVMNDEAGNRSRPTSETDKPEPASQSSSLMNYSQDEINDLFGIDY
ncbi:hypothetical protein C2G38_2029227 [Gigaspora rosea]|uniref:Uncharacterized protein n=1 Tax=Gigaspora rosea TaxID=44941 RepID=A0A397W0K0_9GLOM|nr:hypothetical protein C2G38_2029227 [Gigaspora rosea]